jgi:glycosyltransferase involved in cell wall biosynthesis
MQEIAGNAALYFNPADHNDIAEKMLLLYKDENLRSQLIEKGKQICKQYNWDRSAELFWQSIEKAMG